MCIVVALARLGLSCASWQSSHCAYLDAVLDSYRAGEADRCAVGSSGLEATPLIITAQRACPADSEPVHPSQASSYWHDVVDVDPDPDQETATRYDCRGRN